MRYVCARAAGECKHGVALLPLCGFLTMVVRRLIGQECGPSRDALRLRCIHP